MVPYHIESDDDPNSRPYRREEGPQSGPENPANDCQIDPSMLHHQVVECHHEARAEDPHKPSADDVEWLA